jgi:hypothetical protein
MKTIAVLCQFVEDLLKDHFDPEDVYVPDDPQELEKRDWNDDNFEIYLTTNHKANSTSVDAIEVKVGYDPKLPNNLKIIFPYHSVPRIFRERVYDTIDLSDPKYAEKVIRSCHEVIGKVRVLRSRHDKSKLRSC